MPNPSSVERAASGIGDQTDAASAGNGSVISLLKWIRDNGGSMGGGSTLADGADVVEGQLADAAIVADAAGTVNAKLRGLIKILADVWDSGNHQLKVSSGGGGGGPATIADGADVAEGTTTDPDTALTVIGRLKKIVALLTGTLTVTGPLTDAQLRASAVPVSHGGLTDAQLRASAVPVTTGDLTDAQLRATPVPVSGPLTDTQLRASALPVSGPLTDAQLRASAVPVSLASSPLENGAAAVTDERKTVTTAGTREAFPNVACKAAVFTALKGNTDEVVIGAAATVVAALGTRRGIPLAAGDSVALPVSNLSLLGIDALVNGEGVSYAVLG